MEPSIKNKSNKFPVRELPDSFRDAFSGIKVLFRSENNARIHFIILLLVIIAGIILKISTVQWIAIALASGLVLTTECLNTAIEYLCDVIMPEYDSRIKKAKDLAAASVLVSAVVSVVVGLIVFIPALFRII
jgi:diacylglycerol kinase (ATP)